MRVAINVEFTEEEILKRGEELIRRAASDVFVNAYKAGKKLKINPDLLGTVLSQVLASLPRSKDKPDPGPVAEAPNSPNERESLDQCVRVAPEKYVDEGWYCCRCTAYNGVHRAACRACEHERCDVIVPPPPSKRHAGEDSIQ